MTVTTDEKCTLCNATEDLYYRKKYVVLCFACFARQWLIGALD